jgi:3-hydroxyisobutyrate dehydrogenase
MNKKTVAILGLGAMGSRIAQNLLTAKIPVVVYNRTAAKAKPLIDLGAVDAATPREAAQQADFVISMVKDDEGSRQIWLAPETGAMAGLRKDAIAIESSTLTVNWTRALATAVEQQGAAFLDAPVVGSRPQAEAGKLVYLVGGQTETLAQAQSVLRTAGAATLHHVGAVGQGMAMKLAVNALFGIQVAALAELMGMLSKTGIQPEAAMTCLAELPVTSPAARAAGNLMVMNQHAPLFPIALVEKDFRYVTQTAQDLQTETPASTAVHHIYQTAIAKGLGNDNISSVVHLFD